MKQKIAFKEKINDLKIEIQHYFIKFCRSIPGRKKLTVIFLTWWSLIFALLIGASIFLWFSGWRWEANDPYEFHTTENAFFICAVTLLIFSFVLWILNLVYSILFLNVSYQYSKTQEFKEKHMRYDDLTILSKLSYSEVKLLRKLNFIKKSTWGTYKHNLTHNKVFHTVK